MVWIADGTESEIETSRNAASLARPWSALETMALHISQSDEQICQKSGEGM